MAAHSAVETGPSAPPLMGDSDKEEKVVANPGVDGIFHPLPLLSLSTSSSSSSEDDNDDDEEEEEEEEEEENGSTTEEEEEEEAAAVAMEEASNRKEGSGEWKDETVVNTNVAEMKKKKKKDSMVLRNESPNYELSKKGSDGNVGIRTLEETIGSPGEISVPLPVINDGMAYGLEKKDESIAPNEPAEKDAMGHFESKVHSGVVAKHTTTEDFVFPVNPAKSPNDDDKSNGKEALNPIYGSSEWGEATSASDFSRSAIRSLEMIKGSLNMDQMFGSSELKSTAAVAARKMDSRSATEVAGKGLESRSISQVRSGIIASRFGGEGMGRGDVKGVTTVLGFSSDSMPDDTGKEEEEEEEEGEGEGEGDEDEDEEDSRMGETDMRSLGGAGTGGSSMPAGLGRSMPSLDPSPRASPPRVRPSSTVAQRPAVAAVAVAEAAPDDDMGDDAADETKKRLQMIRVKFLRLAYRLGQTAQNTVVVQVLYRLGLAEQLRRGSGGGGGGGGSRTGVFSFERANAMAEELEANRGLGDGGLDFACTVMVLGKSGVGKSATINSIFDEVKSETNAFRAATTGVREIRGMVHGIKVRVIDTPGLQASFADQRRNERVMASVKHFIKQSPPDIVLYVDRLDMQSRDYGDLPLLRTITGAFGATVWFNAIVVLTHAASAPPDGANGTPLSYEMFVTQRSHVVQQSIRQAAGDSRLMNPVSLVENHPACRVNRAGQRVLPNGQVWKPQLLLLCFASKILAEANSLLKLQDGSTGPNNNNQNPVRSFGPRPRAPPLPFLLSSLLQSRAPLRLPDEQFGNGSDDDSSSDDDDLDDESGSDSEIDYDQLPSFRRLSREELSLLDGDQRRAYFEELEYREKLYQKKQWKEERKRRREMKKSSTAAQPDVQQAPEGMDEEERSAQVPVPMPDMVLPPSFDADHPTYRYRYLETGSQWLVRPVLETHGWDHDSGYEGLNAEKAFVLFEKIPSSISGQIMKDKKETNLQLECAATLKHGEGKATLTGLDVQTVGKDLAYTFRSETRFSNFRRNKTTGGLAVTFLGDTVATGMKIEDKLVVGRRLKLVLNGGAITGRGDTAYGGSLEATLRDEDYPIGRTLTTLGLSVMDWHKDLAIGGNLQSQFMLGKTSMIVRASLNNRGAGQINIRASSSEHLQMALIAIIPVVRAFLNSRFFSSFQPLL